MSTVTHARTWLRCAPVVTGLILASPAVDAHPFAESEYSVRTSVKASDQGLVALVVLEVPILVVMKGIGVERSDDLDVKKRKVDKFNQAIWDRMAEGLTLTIDDAPVKGQWMAIEHPLNGKAAEGFFVYMVGFNMAKPDSLSKDGYSVNIVNKGWADEPMWLSGAATAVDPWRVVSDTAAEVLGENANGKLDQPGTWSRDARLRDMTVALKRGS